jgi:hypothetical protein
MVLMTPPPLWGTSHLNGEAKIACVSGNFPKSGIAFWDRGPLIGARNSSGVLLKKHEHHWNCALQ